MVKMLREDQRLAKHKDFVSGFTALHWAAKHGERTLIQRKTQKMSSNPEPGFLNQFTRDLSLS